MREILFRGKRFDNGEWVCGSLVQMLVDGRTASCIATIEEVGRANKDTPRMGILYTLNKDIFIVHSDTVGQYTGLTDKNGTKIYEGDIATLMSHNPLNYEITVNAKFLFVDGGFVVYLLDRECLVPEFPIRDIAKDTEITVIGNIYDNPELTKISTQHNK